MTDPDVPHEDPRAGRPLLHEPTSAAYAAATSPLNTSAPQRPAAVAVADRPDHVSAAVLAADRRGLEVVVQATGHGAGAAVGSGALLLDTSRLSSVSIDPRARVATVGSGATWGEVNRAAWRHGLLGPAGTAASVSVSGYSFGGGIGWLVRRDGLASDALRRVDFVDGAGRLRTASDDAPDPADREAMWAFRGAGGVGVATTLEVDLFPAPALHAGKLLWPLAALPAVVEAWARALDPVGPDGVGAGVATSISVLHLPPLPTLPAELRGRAAVHLAIADPDGGEGAAALLAAVRAAAAPLVDDWGPADAARLATIHLDPPAAVPAVGTARWLGPSTPSLAVELLSTGAADDSPLALTELRHVGGAHARRDGAVTTVPAPYVFHAVGALGPSPRTRLDEAFTRAREVWSRADAGSTPGSWVDGAAEVGEALPAGTLDRARAAAAAVDPGGRIRRSRLLGAVIR